MADNFDIFTTILNEFQKLEGATARKQAIKAIQAIDKNLSSTQADINTTVKEAVEKERKEHEAKEKDRIDKAVAEALEKDRRERGANPRPSAPQVTAANR